MAQELATHVCVTLYKFSVVGQQRLFKSFAAVAGPNCSCERLKANSFILRYPRGNESYPSAFIKLVKEFTAVRSDEEEVLEEPTATRMRGTHANAPPEAAVKPQSLVSVSGESHLIDHEHIARVWIPDRAGRWMPRPVRIKEELLTLLGSLCQCRVERPDESNSHVVVKGDSEQAVERVFSKLKVMDEVAITRVDFPAVFSFPIMEGDIFCEMKMISLGALSGNPTDRRSRTTLLLPNSKLHKSVRRGLVVSILQSRGAVVPRQIRLLRTQGENLLWDDRPVEMPQAQALSMTQLAPLQEATGLVDGSANDLKTPTGAWVAATDPSLFIDAFQGPKEANLSTAIEMTYRMPVAPTTSKPSTKRRRVVKGALSATKMMTTETDTTKVGINAERDNEFSAQKTSIRPLLPHQRIPITQEVPQEKSHSTAKSVDLSLPIQQAPQEGGNRIQTDQPHAASVGLPSDQKVADKEHVFESNDQQPIIGALGSTTHQKSMEFRQPLAEQVLPDTPSANLLPEQEPSLKEGVMPDIQHVGVPLDKDQAPERRITPHISSVKILPHLRIPNGNTSAKENQAFFKEDGSEKTLVGTVSRAAPSTHGPPITTPYLPQTSINSPFEPHPSEHEWKLVDRAKMGQLIDYSAPIEKLQDPPASDDRGLKHNTMRQKAPSHKLPRGSTALLKSFDDAATQLLNMALGCQGPIGLTVGLGRLLIDPDKGSSEFKNKSFNASEWSSAFPPSHTVRQSALETIFTPRLTTSPIDAQSILDICHSQGRKLFHLPEVVRKVSYILLCKTNENEQITVNVEENGTFKVVGSEIFIGAIDWHFVKRSFDARLAVSAHEPLLHDYKQNGQEIASSLTVSTSSDQQTVLTAKTSGEFVIESVTRHRETAYTVRTYPTLLLHLREVQEFELSVSGKEYRGVLKPSKEMITSEILWYEAFITSPSADAIMTESETLELGDMATWSPEAIIEEEIIQGMHNLATEVVANIDHVGYENKGPKGSSGTKSTAYQTSAQGEQRSLQRDQQSVQTTVTTPGSYW